MPGQGVLGPVAGRAAVLDSVRDGHTVQTGRVRHHLAKDVITTTDATTAEVWAYLAMTTNTGESIRIALPRSTRSVQPVRWWVADRRAHRVTGQRL